jgi:glycosyltransferase involved in cell wall biosynthesis
MADLAAETITGAVSDKPAAPPAVLQVLPALDTGGVERGTVDVAAALARAGGRSFVASAGGQMVHEIERAGATHVTLPLNSKNPLVMHRNAADLAALVYDNGIDIVHARSRAPAWSAWSAARRTRRHFLTTFHGTYNAGNPLKRAYNAVMTRGERVIAISGFIARHVATVYRVDPARIVTIPRGVNTGSFDPAHVSAERVIQLATNWRLPDGMPVVMLPGRLTRWKGQTVLIEAIARLGRRDVCCLLIGSDQGRTGYREELENLIRTRDLGGVVRVIDHCRDMPAAYMLADVVVSASTDPEAFGRVAVEAQAMGRPVVVSDHGASRETVREGETGWFFPPGDVAALAGALSEALALAPDRRQAMASRARRHVETNFTVDLMCRRTIALYAEITGVAGRALP